MTRKGSLKCRGSNLVQYKVSKIHSIHVINLWAQRLVHVTEAPSPLVVIWISTILLWQTKSKLLLDCYLQIFFLMFLMMNIVSTKQIWSSVCVYMYMHVCVHREVIHWNWRWQNHVNREEMCCSSSEAGRNFILASIFELFFSDSSWMSRSPGCLRNLENLKTKS